jgi:hypothetical protein
MARALRNLRARENAAGDERLAEHLFDGPFYLSPASDDRRPACSLVFVQTADGNTGADDLPWAFEQLRAQGVRRLSCVGGRKLAGQLSANRLVDDVYLTTSPRPGGQPGTPIDRNLRGGRLIVRKLGSGAETGVVFEHLRM